MAANNFLFPIYHITANTLQSLSSIKILLQQKLAEGADLIDSTEYYDQALHEAECHYPLRLMNILDDNLILQFSFLTLMAGNDLANPLDLGSSLEDLLQILLLRNFCRNLDMIYQALEIFRLDVRNIHFLFDSEGTL